MATGSPGVNKPTLGNGKKKEQDKMPPYEFILKITPAVYRQEGSSQIKRTGNNFAKGLYKCLKEDEIHLCKILVEKYDVTFLQIHNIQKIDGNFDSLQLRCSVININDLEKLQKSIESGSLSQKLTDYAQSGGLAISFGISPDDKNAEIKIDVVMDSVVYFRGREHFQSKYLSIGCSEEEKKEQKSNVVTINIVRDENDSKTKEHPMDIDYEKKNTAEITSRRNQTEQSGEVHLLRTFHLYLPLESKRVNKVSLRSNDNKDIHGVELINTPFGSYLWQKSIKMSVDTEQFTYRFEVDYTDVKFSKYGIVPELLYQKKEKTPGHVVSEQYFHKSSDQHSSRYHVLPLFSEADNAKGYEEFCVDILRQVDEHKLKDCIMQLYALNKVLTLRLSEACNLVEHIQLQFRDTFYRPKYLAFVAVLCLIFKSVNHISNHNCVKTDIAKSVLLAIQKSSINELPTFCHSTFVVALEELWHMVTQKKFSVLAFMYYAYPFLTVSKFTSMLDSKDKIPLLIGPSSESGKSIALRVIKTLYVQVCEKEDVLSDQFFLERIQRHLPMEAIFHCMSELDHCYGSKTGKYQECFTKSLEILHSTCKRELKGQSKNGNLSHLIEFWKNIRTHRCTKVEELIKTMEDAVLVSLSRSDGNGYKELQQECLNGPIFADRESQFQLLQKVASSKHVDIHYLVIILFNHEKFQRLETEKFEKVICLWFDCLMKKHFVERRKPQAEYIPQLYNYLGDALSVPAVCENEKLRLEIEAMALEFIQVIDIKDVLKKIEDIERFSDQTIEEICKSHIQKLLFQSGGGKSSCKTINNIIQEICGLTSLLVNSRVITGVVKTLLEMSGVAVDMSEADAFLAMVSGAVFWKKVLDVRGSKKYEITSHPIYVKATTSIKQVWLHLTTGTVDCRFLQKLEPKTVDVLDILSSQGSRSKLEKIWKRSFDSIKKQHEDFQLVTSVLQNCKNNLSKGDLSDFTSEVISMLKKAEQELKTGSVKLHELQKEMFFDPNFSEMREHAFHIQTVIESDVFWNVCRDTLDFEMILQKKEEEKIDEDEILKSIVLLMNAGDPNTEEDHCHEKMKVVCQLLDNLVHEGLNKYYSSWEPYVKGIDVSLSIVKEQFQDADIKKEIQIIKQMHKVPNKKSVNALLMYFSSEEHAEKVAAMKSALIAFNVDPNSDADFSVALSSFDQLQDHDLESLSLHGVCQALQTVESVTRKLENEDTEILHAVGHSKSLVEFLQEVADEDIRNLIDAVEEHSEQYVQESTVSCLIDIKRFFQPLLKSDYCGNVADFFKSIKKSSVSSGIKNVPQKVHDCMDNLHSLKALYKNVANRGERTKEIVENVVRKGRFHFSLEEEKCCLTVEYKQDKKTVEHSEAGLSDLRSRALLIMNTEEKKQSFSGTVSKGKDYLSPFVRLIDSAFEISHVLEDLKFSGHFNYSSFEKRVKQEELECLRDMLQNEYRFWYDVLGQCRSKYYFMNFVYSDQIQHLYQYFDKGTGERMIIPVLKYIHRDFEVSEDTRVVFQTFAKKSMDKPELVLDCIGRTIHNILDIASSVSRNFEIPQTTKKLSDVVQEGKLFVAALEDGSRFTIRTVLALYLNTTGHIPEAHQILFCRKDTRWDEISLLVQRCTGAFIHRSMKELFCIANVEMLSSDLQFMLVQKLRRLQGSYNYLLSVICRGNERHPFLDQFRECIAHPKPLTDAQMTTFFKMQWPDTFTITSDLPGLGKTENVRKIASAKQMDVSTLHISGPFHKRSLVQRLMCLNVRRYHVLHVDIGMTDSPVELDSFLFELIVLGCVSAGTRAYFVPTSNICIEIANTINHSLCNSLSTVTCFQRQNLKWEHYSNFRVSKEINSPVQVVCNYLKLLDEKSLEKNDLYFTGPKCLTLLSEGDCKRCLQKHFSTAGDMSFTLVNIFLNVLADQLKKLSASIFFRTANLSAMLGNKKDTDVKSNLVRALEDVSKEFSARSIHSCRSTQAATLSSDDSKLDLPNNFKKITSTAEALAMRVEGMIHWEDSNHLMVLFHQDVQTISALYRDKNKVPDHIRNLFESQVNRKLEDFHLKDQKELQDVLQRLARMKHPPLDAKTLTVMTENYALTPDNLLKMVLVTLRVKANIPVIIMGETGCGKTSLIRYLSQICGVKFYVLSIHAGVTEENIVSKVTDINSEAEEDLKESIWLFFDEINTCDHLGLISDIVCHHKCLGKTLSPNLVLIAACNPYRLREEDSIFTAGLQGKIKSDELSRLVYRVHPLPETMVDYVWDYGSLSEKDENSYILRMVHGTFKDQKLCRLLSDLLTESQSFVRKYEGTESCVSLRDVDRCKRLAAWFVTILDKKKKIKYPGFYSHSVIREEIYTRAIILALALCYHSRFPFADTRTEYRNIIRDVFTKQPDSYSIATERDVAEIIQTEQKDIIDRMDLPEGTAKNTALQENVFVILVCILNRIPVFVVGKPGCSKSLSMQLIRSNLRGKDSRDSFFQTLPQLYCVSFQGSESSTSDGIIKVFDKAKRYQEHNKIEDVMSVVILDEIGLAEISRFNPLKVLHSLLEPENKICPDVAVVGLSNWALDAAKMNRAIHLSRPEMDVEELYQTGISISESIILKPKKKATTYFPYYHKDEYLSEHIKHFLKAIADAYCDYSKQQKFKNFHGLRDYYSLTKHISRILLKVSVHDDKEVADILLRGLLRNLGGLPSEMELIKGIFERHLGVSFEWNLPVLELIKENISDRIGRHLMLITSGDAVISRIEQLLRQNERQYMVIFGSQFEEDLTDDYNYRILSRIILCMEQGFVLILKDLESIYGSLYDMLNQNYTVVGQKKNCRVALGPYSNPMCQVHDDFKCIVLVEESKLDYSDPPFLNRFEKQQFRFADILDARDLEVIKMLEIWIESLCSIPNHHFTPYDVFPVYSADMLASLVLHVHGKEEEYQTPAEIADLCINQLLHVATPEAIVRIRCSELWENNPGEARKVLEAYLSLPLHDGLDTFLSSQITEVVQDIGVKGNIPEYTTETKDVNMDRETGAQEELPEQTNETTEDDLIMDSSTSNSLYDKETQNLSFVIFTRSNIHVLLKDCLGERKFQSEKVGGFKSEKQLVTRIQMFFESDADILLIQFSAKDDSSHLLLTKSAVESCRADYQKIGNLNRNKHVCIIVHLERKESAENSISQLNFLSGWTMATLDSLEEPRTRLPDIMKKTVQQVLNDRRPLFESITDQLFWAFTCIQYSSAGRSINSMKDVLDHMQSDREILEVFENIIFKWIDEQTDYARNVNWQVSIACDRLALSNAATYMEAMEHHILHMMKTPLAMIVFRLEQANALECFFIDDCHSKDRRHIWCEIVCETDALNLKEIKPPSGPECYSCSAPTMKLKMPFSQVIILKVEQLQTDFMDTLKKLKTYCEIEDEDVPVAMFLELVSRYQDIVMLEVGDWLTLDYKGKREDYVHDYCCYIISKSEVQMDEGVSISILQWGLSNYVDLTAGDFGELISKVHAAFWTYSSTIMAMLHLVHLLENVSSELFSTIHKLSLKKQFFKHSEENIEHYDVDGVVMTIKENEESTEFTNPELQKHEEMEDPELIFHDICAEDESDQSLNSKSELHRSSQVFNEDVPIKNSEMEEMFPSVVTADIEDVSVHDIEPVFTDDAWSKTDEELSDQEHLVRYICHHVFPTEELLKTLTVPSWKRIISNMLPLVGTISLELEAVHKLRFCNDIANVLIIPFDLPSDILATFGSYLSESPLDSEHIFYFLMKTIQELHSNKKICCIQLQRLVCLYIGRCLASNPDSEALMKNVLLCVKEDKMVDPKLSFFGPTLRHLIQMELSEDENILKDLLLKGEIENDFLEELDQSLCNLDEKSQPDSVFAALLVDIFERNVFDENVSADNLRNVESSNDEIIQTTLLADKLLRSECFSLRHLIALAYLKSFLKNFVRLMEEDFVECSQYVILCNNINPLLKPGSEDELDTNRSKGLLHFLLKCLSDAEIPGSLQTICQSLTDLIPNLGLIEWEEESNLSSLEYNPLAIYLPEVYAEYISFLSTQPDDETCVKKFVMEALTAKENIMIFYGAVLNRYTLKRTIRGIDDSEKKFANKLLDLGRQHMKPEQMKLLELLLGTVDFENEIYKLTPETPEHESYILSVLLHLLCILMSHECSGNVWFQCMTQPQLIDLKDLPGNSGPKTELKLQAFTCSCRNRCVSKLSRCPVCEKEIIETSLCREFDCEEEMAVIPRHILRFVTTGCLMNSLALKRSNDVALQKLLQIKDKDEVSELLKTRLYDSWDNLQKLLGISNKDLCGLMNVILLNCADLFLDPSWSPSNAEHCHSVEEKLTDILDETIKDRFTLLQKYRSIVYQVHNIPPDALVCQLDEVMQIDEGHQRIQHLPSLFRYTGMPTRENLYGELFIDQKYLAYPFLTLVLQDVKKLSLPQFITPLLKWHLSAVTFGSYVIRKVECKEIVVGKLITRGGNDRIKKIFRKQFKQFEDAWNTLKLEYLDILKNWNPSLPEMETVSTASKLDQCLIMDSSSPLYVVLCTLVEVQNSFLDEVLSLSVQKSCASLNFMNTDDQSARIAVVPLVDVEDKDIIKYEWCDEVLQYTQCATEPGHGEKIVYDFAKIEMELAHEILHRKPYITIPKALPKMVFTDELFQNSVSLLQELRSSVPQEPLTSEIVKGMERKKDNDATESLTLLGMILTILKKTGGDSSQPLVEFIEKWKDVITQVSFRRLLPEPEHCVRLCHVVGLYEWLEELNGENVAESLDDTYRIPLPPDAKSKLEEIAGSNIKLLDKLNRTLKLFVHRCLSSRDNDIDRERQLVDYIIDPMYWPDGTISGGNLVVDSSKIKLLDVVSKTIMVEHIHEAIAFITQKIEEYHEKDKRISSIAATYQASKKETGAKPKKGRTARKGFGKT